MSDDAPRMTSYRPYLLRALAEWINDNGMTPHILVDAGVAGVRVPPGAVREGKVVLNIADRAVVGLSIDNEWIEFTARFGGVSRLLRCRTCRRAHHTHDELSHFVRGFGRAQRVNKAGADERSGKLSQQLHVR